MDYWRYGVDELAMLARERGIHLAIVPGDHREDARLDEASTLPVADLRRIGAYFASGGPANIAACLRFVAGGFMEQPPAPEPVQVPAFGIFQVAAGKPSKCSTDRPYRLLPRLDAGRRHHADHGAG